MLWCRFAILKIFFQKKNLHFLWDIYVWDGASIVNHETEAEIPLIMCGKLKEDEFSHNGHITTIPIFKGAGLGSCHVLLWVKKKYGSTIGSGHELTKNFPSLQRCCCGFFSRTPTTRCCWEGKFLVAGHANMHDCWSTSQRANYHPWPTPPTTITLFDGNWATKRLSRNRRLCTAAIHGQRVFSDHQCDHRVTTNRSLQTPTTVTARIVACHLPFVFQMSPFWGNSGQPTT